MKIENKLNVTGVHVVSALSIMLYHKNPSFLEFVRLFPVKSVQQFYLELKKFFESSQVQFGFITCPRSP